MDVVDLGEGEREGRAGVADRLALYGLSLVDVSHRDVIDGGGGEEVCAQAVAAVDGALADAVQGGPVDRAVGRGDQGLPLLAASPGGQEDLGVDVTCLEEGAAVAGGEVGRAEEGHGRDPDLDLPLGAAERDQDPLQVEGGGDPGSPLGEAARKSPDDVNAEGAEERAGRLQALGRVVVAADHHDLESRPALAGGGQELVEGPLGGDGRGGRVEHVTGDEERVHGLALEALEEPAEEGRVFEAALDPMEGVAEMPVAGVEDFHGGRGGGPGACKPPD